jgi:hypothetical protein
MKCPKCGTVIQDNGFMIICPGCKASLFLDADGNLYDPSAGLPDSSPETAPETFEQPEVPISAPPGHDAPFSFADFPPIAADESAAQHSFEPGPSSRDEPFSYEAPLTEEPMPELALDGAIETLFMPVENEVKNPDFGPPDDPLGINDYANSEISQAKDGLLVFRIFISGIDSKEVKQSIREAIEDSRFGWDAAEIIGKIKRGDLRIEQVSAVKASILINRIKRLPVKIRWEQYAITQLEGP